MKIDNVAKQIIRMELEEALLNYEDYKKGYTIPYKLVPYLDMLDEIDEIRSYIYSKINYKHKDEHKALVLFTSGNRVPDIIDKLRKCEIYSSDIRAWIYGDEEIVGFIPAMFDKFIELNRYCPFCNTGSSGGPASQYPLSGKVCPHKEMEWSEEEA